jgi:hypothetical protein
VWPLPDRLQDAPPVRLLRDTSLTDGISLIGLVPNLGVNTLLQPKSKGKDHKNARENLKELGLGRSSMQRKQRRGRTFPLLQPPCQRQREKNSVNFCMKLQEASFGEGHENEF